LILRNPQRIPIVFNQAAPLANTISALY